MEKPTSSGLLKRNAKDGEPPRRTLCQGEVSSNSELGGGPSSTPGEGKRAGGRRAGVWQRLGQAQCRRTRNQICVEVSPIPACDAVGCAGSGEVDQPPTPTWGCCQRQAPKHGKVTRAVGEGAAQCAGWSSSTAK